MATSFRNRRSPLKVKSLALFLAAAVASYLAAFVDHKPRLAPGEIGYVLSLSPHAVSTQPIRQSPRTKCPGVIVCSRMVVSRS